MSPVLLEKSQRAIPPLESGDCLTREEFYRRWEAMPDLKFAERIEGVVNMQAATRVGAHGVPHSQLGTWLGLYAAETPGAEAGDGPTVQADEDNDPQPDCCLFILPEFGGQCRFTEDDYLECVPELIGEISTSSASRDLHVKLRMYERVGVKEYLVWKTLEEEFVFHRAQRGKLRPVAPDSDGMFRSQVFPGLWLDPAALIAGNMRRVFDVLHEGLASPEHSKFVDHLAAKRAK